MSTKEKNFRISDSSTEVTLNKLTTGLNQFLDKEHETMRKNDTDLYFFLKKRKQQFSKSKIYKQMAILTYSAIQEELKASNTEVKITAEDIGLFLVNESDFPNNSAWQDNVESFLANLESTSPLFVHKLVGISKYLLRGLEEKNAFYLGILDMCKLYAQKSVANSLTLPD